MYRSLRLMMLLSLLYCGQWLAAQPYAVTITNQVVEYSQNLSDYSQPNRVFLTLLSTDDRTFYQVALKVKISGSGFSLQTRQNYTGTTFMLIKNQPRTLTGSQLSGLFNPNNMDFTGFSVQEYIANGNRLPEGPLTICIEAYDLNYINGLPVSNSACSSGVIQTAQPPTLVSPAGEQPVITPQNLLFAWQPMHAAGFPVEYTLEVYENINGLSPDLVIGSTAPYFSQTTNLTNYQYTAVDPLLDVQKDYLFRVKVTDLANNTAFENNGWSAIGQFHFAQACEAPTGPYLISATENTLTTGWQPPAEGTVTSYELQLVAVGSTDTSYYEVDGTITSYKFNELVAGMDYHVEICAACDNAVTAPCVPFGPVSTTSPSEPTCDPPGNLIVLDTTTNTIELSWEWPVGQTISSPIIRWKKASAAVFSDSSSLATDNFTIFNLTPGTEYDIHICYNCTEAEQVCNSTTVTTPEFTGMCYTPRSPATSNITANSVDISWSPPSNGDPPDNYIVKYKASGDANFTEVNVSTTSYHLSGLAASTTYNTQICIICADGTPYCISKDFTTSEPPNPSNCPTIDSLFATQTMTESIRLEWTGPSGFVWYQLYYKLSTDAEFTQIQNTYLKYHNIHNLAPETTYDFKVCYLCQEDNSTICQTTQVSTASPCEPVSGLIVNELEDNSIAISWDSIPNVGYYSVSKKLAAATTFYSPITVDQSAHLFQNLQAGTTYDFQVCYPCPYDNTTLCNTIQATTEPPGCDLENTSDLVYECGAATDNSPPPNAQLIQHLEEGDTLKAGDFHVVLTEVSGHGPFFGDGYIEVPYLNMARLNVKFNGIDVDFQCRMVNGHMEVTGAGVDILSDEMENLLSDILSTIETVEDILNAIEEILTTVDEIVATVEPYLPEEVITQLLEARYELAAAQEAYEQAQATGDQAAIDEAEAQLEAAHDQLQAANQAYIDAVVAFLGEFLEIIKQAVQQLFNDLAPAEEAYTTAKDNLDDWLNNQNASVMASLSNQEVSGAEDLFEASGLVDLTATLNNETFEQQAATFYEKEQDYNVWQTINLINQDLQSGTNADQLGNLFLSIGISLLDGVGTRIQQELPEQEIIDYAKTEIHNGLIIILQNF